MPVMIFYAFVVTEVMYGFHQLKGNSANSAHQSLLTGLWLKLREFGLIVSNNVASVQLCCCGDSRELA